MLLDFLSGGLFFEDQLAEFFLFSPQFCGSFSDLGVELSPCRVDDLCCIINRLGLIIYKSVQVKPFPGVFEEILLIPSAELRSCYFGGSGLPFGADDGNLATAVSKLANFAYPNSFFAFGSD